VRYERRAREVVRKKESRTVEEVRRPEKARRFNAVRAAAASPVRESAVDY